MAQEKAALPIALPGKTILSASLLDYEQLCNAIIEYDPRALRFGYYAEWLLPGQSGWVTFIVPEERIMAFITCVFWGDTSVLVAVASNVQENIISASFIPPTPVTLFFPLHHHELKSFLWYRENFDPVNSAEYHMWDKIICPLVSDWREIWKPILARHKEEFIKL